jgi:hypothetical protein
MACLTTLISFCVLCRNQNGRTLASFEATPNDEDTEMTLHDFRQSLNAARPPAELTLALLGLWWDAKGDWTRAHESAQQDEGVEGSWVHAYLHRKEGDQSNAAYWYSRAGKPVCREPLDAEWLSIVKALLGEFTTVVQSSP